MTALFPALRSADGCAGRLVWLTGGGRLPRCTGCGHRQPDPVTCEQPRHTRTQPPWTWPGELRDRRRARNSAP